MILTHLDQNLWAFLEIFRDLRKMFVLKDLAENSHILSQIWLNCRKFWTFEAVFHKRKNNCTPAKYSVGPLHGCQVFFCDFLKIILYVDLVISRAQSQKNGKKSKMTEISVKLWALDFLKIRNFRKTDTHDRPNSFWEIRQQKTVFEFFRLQKYQLPVTETTWNFAQICVIVFTYYI